MSGATIAVNRKRRLGIGRAIAKRKKAIITILILACLLTFFIILINSDADIPPGLSDEKLAQALSNRVFLQSRINTYDAYKTEHESAARPIKEIDAVYEGESPRITGETGIYDWTVNIDEPGLYNIEIEYLPIEGKSGDIQRTILINGEIPFYEAENLTFARVWVNEESRHLLDTQGNDIRPRQVESFQWQTAFLRDNMGYYPEPLLFYFPEGQHTISLQSLREPMAVGRLTLVNRAEILPYAETLNRHTANGITKATGQLIPIEAESAQRKSSPMLYPVADRSSPAVSPYSARYIRNNTIGGNNWRSFGQWIEWDVEVPETGLYHIALNVRQNFNRGVSSYRKLTINGEVPFTEAQSLAFPFYRDWRVVTLGNDNEPYLFYFEAGVNTIRLEVVLGEFVDIIRIMEEEIYALNHIYRQLIMIMSTEPDVFRDYQIGRKIPELSAALANHRDILFTMYNRLKTISGGEGQRDAVIRTTALTLDILQRDVEVFTRRLQMFKTDLGALGSWLLSASEQPLQLDIIYIAPPAVKIPAANTSFFARMGHEISSLFYSFIIDYSNIGNVASDADGSSITVWIGTGRDQANTIKALIDERFTPSTNISVNLMLTQMDALLPATVSGQGPDVAMQVGSDVPMNFGMRGAIHDISGFPDYEEIIKRFPESAIVPFSFEGRSFALPETFTFNMMFYRRDILDELDIELPQTWDDVNSVISKLSADNLTFSLAPAASADEAISSMFSVTNSMAMFLYQNGGTFYTPDNRYSALDSDIAMRAFRQLTEYYTDFGLEVAFDFVNRFRTGESPLGVVDYTTYNTLQVFAPEIRGLWGFTIIPGTEQPDGTINRSTPGGGTAVVIMEGAQDKDAAWEFLKWWTSAEIQTQYGREMEALMGPAARYPTANLEALSNMPWPVDHYNALQEQLQHVVGIPQIPGGYFTPRHVYNAFAEVAIQKIRGPRDALTAHIRFINEEIAYKRAEFNLD